MGFSRHKIPRNSAYTISEKAIRGYGYVDNILHIGTLCLRLSFLSFFFLGFILLLLVSMCVCLCDYNTYYKCNNKPAIAVHIICILLY